MLVNLDWLKDYVNISLSPEELGDRLTHAGLNLEFIEQRDSQTVIDLEVTSNRPDCLGHLGVAREIAAITKQGMCQPEIKLQECADQATDHIQVSIEDKQFCPVYVARVIRGVKVGPSPAWLVDRLKSLGIATINNVVDATNYVMFECAQPLHAFDFQKLAGSEVTVRKARDGETIKAIDQREYRLTSTMGVIADQRGPVAVAGVMGGFESEISDETTTILLESASFNSLSVRNTSRSLELFSPSSYRFERALDQHGVAWANARCASLIQKLAGGEVLSGEVIAGELAPAFGKPIELRFSRIPEILGIEVPTTEVSQILQLLGCQISSSTPQTITVLAPSFRRDLVREIDLIEEVARIHGYENIPENVPVPLCSSRKTTADRVAEKVRQTLVGSGFFEAMTVAFTSESQQNWFAPRSVTTSLMVDHSRRRNENLLRQSLVPSLLNVRRENIRRGNHDAHLFEIARVYLGSEITADCAQQPAVLGCVSGLPFLDLKGILAAVAMACRSDIRLETTESSLPAFAPYRGAELWLNGKRWGWCGELHPEIVQQAGMKDQVTVAEVDMALLEALFQAAPQFRPIPQYQPMIRDLNFSLAEEVQWIDLEKTIQLAAGPLLEAVRFSGQYRGKQLGEGQKSYLATLVYRSYERTLTSEEVDEIQKNVMNSCLEHHGAIVRS